MLKIRQRAQKYDLKYRVIAHFAKIFQSVVSLKQKRNRKVTFSAYLDERYYFSDKRIDAVFNHRHTAPNHPQR